MMKQYRKITKSFIVVLSITLASSININKIKADTILDGSYDSSTYPGSGQVTESGNITPNNPIEGVGVEGSCYQSSCKINRYFKVWSNVDVNLYDMYGNKLGTGVNEMITPRLAGTYIGVQVEENKGYESWATYTYTAKKKVHTCRPYYWDPNLNCNKWGKNCKGGYAYGAEYKNDCGCFGMSDDLGYEWQSYPGDEGACAAQATPYTIHMTSEPSYDITYRDSNDIDTQSPSSSDRYNTMGTKTQGQCNNESDLGTKTNSMDCSFKYEREKTCINVKTGQVAYVAYSEPCLEDEYEITQETADNGKKYWKYFIPLNANSTDGFKVSLVAKGNQIGVLCKQYIDKYPHYQSLIVDINGNPLSSNPTEAKLEVESGCKYQTEITIPVIQKFYNEQDNGINFKGFNFYYKPIDINNPFPNGLNETSLWHDWNEDVNKAPDISESYEEITYYANTAGNEEKIREYNNKKEQDENKKDYPYTSWKGKNDEDIDGGMNINGTSNFIKNQGIVISYVTTESFYPLGCGPWNEFQNKEDGSKNYFYQPECDRS